MLEPDEVKVSCPILRGLGAGNSPRLPGGEPLILVVHSGCAALVFFSLSHAGSIVRLTVTDPDTKTNYSPFLSKSTPIKLFFMKS